MISIEKALEIIEQNKIILPAVEMDLSSALGCYLAEDVFSPIPMPPFDQSAMDGYAICGEGSLFEIIGEVQAGSTFEASLQPGQAVRIFTGAITPENTTSIAKQEIVERNGNQIKLNEEVKIGTSIRRKGEEISQNEMALPKSTRLNPAAIGFLSGLGIEKVKVHRNPKVGLIVSGNELTQAGNPLEPGKIYESNSKTLKALLEQIGLTADLYFVEDSYDSTVAQISNALEESDLIILTGGISVGDYDFVRSALEELKVEELFYKVKQKPGKPIYFGKQIDKRIFALPGNPAAVFTCFQVYVKTMIGFMKGAEYPYLAKTTAKITHDHFKKGGRAHFLKAGLCRDQVQIYTNQSSAMLSSFVNANCLVYMNEEEKEYKKGDEVEVYLIDN